MGDILSSTVDENFSTAILLAWYGKLTIAQVMDQAAQLEARGLAPLAAVLYDTWLKRNDTPQNHFIWFNQGVSLFSQGDTAGAKGAYEKAIALVPAFVQPRFNLGLVEERLGNIDAAIGHWCWVIDNVSHDDTQARPIVISSLNNLGRVLEDKREYARASDYLTRSLALNPDQPEVLHHWIFLREKQCAWPVYLPIEGVSLEQLRASTSALAMLSISDNPEEQLTAARNYSTKKIPANLPTLAPSRSYGHKKIRVGYCSSDFCLHPVALLTAELFECHNRDQFEIYGFCWSREDGSEIRQRIIKSMDHFLRIDTLDDEAAAKLIREHEIDVLVDLHGQTKGARAAILAYRPAPIQVTYLGLPATTGLPCVDYVIADKFLIPQKLAKFYSEKPLYMPHVYQVSDRQRQSSPPPSRKTCGLPEDAFVFCCFNNNYKYTPEVFSAWLNILRRVPHSILWLLSDNQWAETNLRREAESHGIDSNRLIFSPRVSPADYLARFTAADLFLDSFPFNAGTTANDALWMGLPVLTMSGRSFASRMAGALLTAANMEQLITYNLSDYENKAVELANRGNRCEDLKQHLKTVKEHGGLFDTPKFTKNLENKFKKLVHSLPQ